MRVDTQPASLAEAGDCRFERHGRRRGRSHRAGRRPAHRCGYGEDRFSICQSGAGGLGHGRGLSAAESRRLEQSDRDALYG